MQDINDVIASNAGLVYKQLQKFNLYDDPEAESIAFEALYNAIVSFKESSNTKLSTYATVCIYNALGTYLRTLNKKRQLETLSYNAIAFSDDRHECEFIDLVTTGYTTEEQCIKQETISEIRKALMAQFNAITSEKQKCVIRCWISYDFECTTLDIAKEVGVSQSYVSQTLNVFKGKLKKRLKEDYDVK